ncbi:hypothetical protein HYR69_04770, partial [Candidatus Sumerlaeota bacterium]|nr:hypothetical protein [Candidatus Sumerlaeota bacterium]
MRRSNPLTIPSYVTLLFPEPAGLEQNPLYLRITSQAFNSRSRRNRLMWWLPPELTRAPGKFINQLGILPFLLILSPYLFLIRGSMVGLPPGSYLLTTVRGLTDLTYVLGAVLLYTRAIEGESSSLVGNFLHNGIRDRWGEALYLTGLRPVDYERALFAGIWQREISSLLARFLFLLCVIGPVACVWAFVFQYINPFYPMRAQGPSLYTAYRITSFALPICLAAFIEFSLISALNLALSLRDASLSAEKNLLRRILRIPGPFFGAASFIVVHLPGLAAYFLWTVFLMRSGFRLEATEFGISDMRGLFILILPNVPFALIIV